MDELKQTQLKYYDIDWNKVKTIKDVKSILKVLASKVVIDHDNEEDVRVYESLESFLIPSTE
jgi:hypothetical protein